ncbi:ATP-binding protein [Enterovibrio norvegicus]|uniref:ATP-binding protein n=1 Tax=Enterovibrio norvegicus TaxID=188144 RepID=UPI00354E5197
MKPFDLTPDPKVLIALTHTPLKPMDALSELIDNAIDSFALSRNSGFEVSNPMAIVDLPSRKELEDNLGTIRVRDNGIGMSPSMAEKALKAGFSGNNPYDSLGLFGMGLNIATGKLGSRTTVITARKGDSQALKVVVDLIAIQEQSSFEVIPELVDKPDGFENGTIVEISNWWPKGNANSDFIQKLIAYGRPKVRSEIGRRYSTLLKQKFVNIVVNGESCKPFHHCVWGSNRFVEHKGIGRVYAKREFSEVIGTQKRCTECFVLVPEDRESCPACHSFSLRTIDETVKGWVGIQRYDDESHFGIDLIRNGRAIRLLEKAAFFEFVDEFGISFKDYPADSTYGRIIGEVEIDHVPVDFMKQDFQRSSPEWQQAIHFLRGSTSLWPGRTNGVPNDSPIYTLFQGFRRVRQFGKKDLYMGYWDEEKNKASRIPRPTEKEYLRKFHEGLPGYFDDGEWWKLVEEADTKPVEPLVECPECSAENLQSAELCMACGATLIGKPCLECEAEIQLSALSCNLCGASQVPEVVEPWLCLVCNTKNTAEAENCSKCDSPRGTPNKLSPEYLQINSDYDESLSISGCSVKLADGTNSQPIDVECFSVHRPMVLNHKGSVLPVVVNKGEAVKIFVDKTHPLFKSLAIKPEEIIASEVAYYKHVSNGRLTGTVFQPAHSLSNIEWEILNKYWSDSLSDSSVSVREDVESLFAELASRLPDILVSASEEIFEELVEKDKKELVGNLIDKGEDISKMEQFKSDGSFMRFVGVNTIVSIFDKHTACFFDGAIWSEPFSSIVGIQDSIMDDLRLQTRNRYLNCLEDCASFLGYQNVDPVLVKRTRASLEFLKKGLES